jgi:multimeric flavodoxin WrbA
MERNVSRRSLLEAAGAAAVAGLAGRSLAAEGQPAAAATAPAGAAGGKVRIVAVSCSPRKGKTTAAGLRVCLEEAAKVDPAIETELIELAEMNIPVFVPGGPGGDFAKIAPRFTDPAVGGIIVGSPVYFGCMSSLCKAMLDHWMAFRGKLALAGKVGGVLAVGAGRNGGQELTILGIQQALMAQQMILVGDGAPTSHRGATLWNSANDDITKDEMGLATARNLGKWMAQIALRLAGRAAVTGGTSSK